MKLRRSRRAPIGRPLVVAFALAALVVLSAFLAAQDASASTFDPQATLSIENPLPGANSDLIGSFQLAAPDANFGGVIVFTPPEWGVASDADVPDGALVGQLSSQAVLVLLNDACANPLFPAFQFLDATTDRSATTTFGEQFDDDDSNGIPNGAQLYPDYLARILVDENENPLQLRARLYAQTVVVGIDVSLNFAIFEPGINLRGTQLDPALGFPSVTVLQALGDPALEPELQPITDFCSPLTTSTRTFGLTKDNPNTTANEAGTVFRTNPAAGKYNFSTFAVSQRDADNDGIENALDTCPFSADPSFDPRRNTADPSYAGDDDKDGIPNSCDPTPNQNLNLGDHDQDGYLNRGDNCPLVQNGLVPGTSVIVGPNNQLDTDSDGLGDVCDPNQTTDDGHLHETCVSSQVTIGAGGPAPSGEIPISDTTCPPASAGGPPPPPPPGNNAPTCGGADIVLFQNTPSSPFDLDCSDPDGDSLDCSVVSDGTKGTLNITSCTSATYAPDAGATGSDSATYKANDGELDSDTAKVSVDIEPIVVGINLKSLAEAVSVGGSTTLQAICAEEQNGVKPVPGVAITFKIDSQPGSDADLDGQAEVTKTSDADGVAEVTLNAGSTVGDIVVSATADDCGTDPQTQTATHTITVALALPGTAGPAGGAGTGVGSLAPVVASIPAWAAIASGLGISGLLGSLAAIARFLRRRR